MTTLFQNRDLVEVKKFDKNNFPLWKQHIQFIFTFRKFREIVNITHANDVEDTIWKDKKNNPMATGIGNKIFIVEQFFMKCEIC
jgi:hypothetical protein